MNLIALKMMLGDRTKYFGLLFGITFTSFLVTFATSYFGGMMTRSFALISENPQASIWVMDPAVVAVDHSANLPASALDRVRGVEGVLFAEPLAIGSAEVRFPNGSFQTFEVIGVDDAILPGIPRMKDGATASVLRFPETVIVDEGGSEGKLATAALSADQWPRGRPRLGGPARILRAGDELLVNDARVRVGGQSEALPRFPPRPILFTTYSTAQHLLLPERRRITFILVATAPGKNSREVARLIEARTGLRARAAEDFEKDTVNWMIENSEDVGDAVTMLTIAILVGFGVTGVMMYMFTTESLRYYAVFSAMGAAPRALLAMVGTQTGFCALLGTGLGLGLCVLAGHAFSACGFPFRMMWFAPALGGVVVLLVACGAAALSLWPVLKLQPVSFLSGR